MTYYNFKKTFEKLILLSKLDSTDFNFHCIKKNYQFTMIRITEGIVYKLDKKNTYSMSRTETTNDTGNVTLIDNWTRIKTIKEVYQTYFKKNINHVLFIVNRYTKQSIATNLAMFLDQINNFCDNHSGLLLKDI